MPQIFRSCLGAIIGLLLWLGSMGIVVFLISSRPDWCPLWTVLILVGLIVAGFTTVSGYRRFKDWVAKVAEEDGTGWPNPLQPVFDLMNRWYFRNPVEVLVSPYAVPEWLFCSHSWAAWEATFNSVGRTIIFGATIMVACPLILGIVITDIPLSIGIGIIVGFSTMILSLLGTYVFAEWGRYYGTTIIVWTDRLTIFRKYAPTGTSRNVTADLKKASEQTARYSAGEQLIDATAVRETASGIGQWVDGILADSIVQIADISLALTGYKTRLEIDFVAKADRTVALVQAIAARLEVAMMMNPGRALGMALLDIEAEKTSKDWTATEPPIEKGRQVFSLYDQRMAEMFGVLPAVVSAANGEKVLRDIRPLILRQDMSWRQRWSLDCRRLYRSVFDKEEEKLSIYH